jgi:hypothetical protein
MGTPPVTCGIVLWNAYRRISGMLRKEISGRETTYLFRTKLRNN